MWAPTHQRKLFIGGLDNCTTDETLKEHFSAWGEIMDAVVMKDNSTNRSRGFGFITYTTPEEVDAAQNARPHKVDGRLVETKRAVPRNETNNLPGAGVPAHQDANFRLFIGALPQDVKEKEIKDYFSNFGKVTSVSIMYDKTTNRHRGFAFVEYNDYDPVDKVILTKTHSLKGRYIDVKKAVPKLTGQQMAAVNNQAAAAAAHPFNSMNMPASAPIVDGMPVNAGSNRVRNNVPSNQSYSMNNPALMNNMGMAPPFFPWAFPNMQGATMPKPGWQYQISNNAEVLQKTGDNCMSSMKDDNSSSSSSEEMDTDEEDNPYATSSWKYKNGDRCPPSATVLVIEPFYGGSHKQLLDTLLSDDAVLRGDKVAMLTLPSKKWHWRARTSALYFSQKIPFVNDYKILFASSTLNLCELIGLRPDLNQVRKILYFHENQLVYPVQKKKERDFQYGYNQILSCMAADVVVFNSQYNLDSFLREIPRHLKMQPDHRPDAKGLVELIGRKSEVIYFPIMVTPKIRPIKDESEPLHILWPHRWEHDKDPSSFFETIYHLVENSKVNFRLSVLGEKFNEIPPVFKEAKAKLGNFIVNWGYIENKQKYWEILHTADVVVSTAHHEFFGVSMLEAVNAGCYPLCPNRLVYPEIFPQECLYNTMDQLKKLLTQWCNRPHSIRGKRSKLDLASFAWDNLRDQYSQLFNYQ